MFPYCGNLRAAPEFAAIRKHNLKTLSEDDFLNLIATRKGPGDLSEKEKKKREKEEKFIRDSAKEIGAREKAAKGSKLIRGCVRSLLGHNVDLTGTTGSRQETPRRNYGPIAMPHRL